jgi:superfamily II DNA or RNA helicase
MNIELQFNKGTLIIKGLPQENNLSLSGVLWDSRTHTHRAEANRYRCLLKELDDKAIKYSDHARDYNPTNLSLKEEFEPRHFQQEGLRAWIDNDHQGVVVLPTGAGKTYLAAMAIKECDLPTLIHVPTIDLMHQWYEVLTNHFTCKVGLIGGGYNDAQQITVSTYDSALIHVNYRGNQYGLTVFDECHHLPGNQFKYVALCSIAPYRLGLTATPEREDGKEEILYRLIGNICYQSNIRDLTGSTLAPYDIVTIEVDLTESERQVYEESRNKYLDFLREKKINVGSKWGWQRFLSSTKTSEGREAYKAYRAQKKLSLAAEAKLHTLWDLIQNHRGERILVFTQENEMAYEIGRLYFLPVLTHLTKVKERKALLNGFREGLYSILVTSKVLNEGVDVPDANVAIVLSGSGSVREHVQRLGRILRSRPGKRAVLYEVISKNTSESQTNHRRRQHTAYNNISKD